MKRTVAHLQQWGGNHGRMSSLHEVLKDFSASWDLQWDQQKEDFVRSTSWPQLQWLTERRDRLRATLSGDANVERPNQQDSLQQLLNLKSTFSSGSFPGLDLAIQQLTAHGSMGPADTQCETVIDN